MGGVQPFLWRCDPCILRCMHTFLGSVCTCQIIVTITFGRVFFIEMFVCTVLYLLCLTGVYFVFFLFFGDIVFSFWMGLSAYNGHYRWMDGRNGLGWLVGGCNIL